MTTLIDQIAPPVDLTECDRARRGHAWFESNEDVGWNSRRKYNSRDIDRCERCGMVRVSCFDSRMELVQRWYDPPEGWDERWGLGNQRPTGPEIRRLAAQKGVEKRRTRKKK